MGGVGVSAYLSLILRRRGGRLFEAGRLLTFSACRMGAYPRWALIRGWALIRINTVRRIFQSVFYGKADFNVSIEVTAEKLAENLKKLCL